MEELYMPNTSKVKLLNNINMYMFGENVGDVLGFQGKRDGTSMIVSYNVTDVDFSGTSSRSDFPLKHNMFAGFVNEVNDISFIPHDTYIEIKIAIDEFFDIEQID